MWPMKVTYGLSWHMEGGPSRGGRAGKRYHDQGSFLGERLPLAANTSFPGSLGAARWPCSKVVVHRGDIDASQPAVARPTTRNDMPEINRRPGYGGRQFPRGGSLEAGPHRRTEDANLTHGAGRRDRDHRRRVGP